MKVSEFMAKKVISISSNQTVETAAKLMLDQNISALPVLNDHSELVGIITESDFVGKKANIPHALVSIKRILGQIFYFDNIEEIFLKAKKIPINGIMTKKPVTVTPDYNLSDVVDLMIRKSLKRLPVVDNNLLVGIITRHDILKAFTLTKPQIL